jgi:hypothetical protein
MNSWFDGRARMSGAYGPRRHIFCDDRSSSNYGAVADGDARMDETLRCKPSLRSDRNGLGNKREARLFVVMSTGTQMGSLGNDGLRSQPDHSLRIEYCAIGDPALVSKFQVPRCPDACSWVNMHPAPNSGSEEAEQ